MERGTTLFICTECKKVFLAPDVEYRAMDFSVPMPCERCGSIRTMPLRISISSKYDNLNPNRPLEMQLDHYSIYKDIWETMEKQDSNGRVEQEDTPDEQYRTGIKYLNGTLRSYNKAEVLSACCYLDLNRTLWGHNRSDIAFYWLMKAAKRGHAQAQYQVGVMLRDRLPVPEYLQKPPFCYTEGTTYQWISKAAEQGLPEAMCYLGNMYLAGDLVEKDLKKAIAWHLKAVASGLLCTGMQKHSCSWAMFMKVPERNGICIQLPRSTDRQHNKNRQKPARGWPCSMRWAREWNKTS